MPFVSEAQRRFMWAKHPRIARRWSDEMKAKGQPQSNLTEKLHPQVNPRRRHLKVAFDDEIMKIAAGQSRIKAIRLARQAAPIVAKRIRGIRRRYRTLRRPK